MGTSPSIYKEALSCYKVYKSLYIGTSLIFLDLRLIYFFFLQFQYFLNIYFLFICQALIEGARLDYFIYIITLLIQLLYLYNCLACTTAQLIQLPSLHNYLVRIITQFVRLPSLYGYLVHTITQFAQSPSLHNYLACRIA